MTARHILCPLAEAPTRHRIFQKGLASFMSSSPPPAIPKRVMVIMAHPDDAEFSCSGTVAKYAAAGAHVEYVLATSGNKGSHEPDMTPEKLAPIREAEQRAAAEALGVAKVIFLRHNDAEVEVTLAFR